MDISNDIRYAGVNDHEVDLFEGLSFTVLNQKILALPIITGFARM